MNARCCLAVCPESGKYPEFTLLKDLDNFARNLRLVEFFSRQPRKTNNEFQHTTSGQWTPDANRDKHLDMYIEAMQNDIMRAYKTHKLGAPNLSRKEQEALLNLSNREDIVIKPANKGCGIVIFNKEDYINEGMRQLLDRKFYKPLDSDPTKEHKELITTALQDLAEEGAVDAKLCRSLISGHATPGRFYMLPKIHKKDHPERPNISGTGTLTETISCYIDFLIKDIPPTHPSYLHDMNHFL